MTQQKIRGIIGQVIGMQVKGTSTYLFTLHPLDCGGVYKAVFVEPGQAKVREASSGWRSDLPPGAETANPVYDDNDLKLDALKLKLAFLTSRTSVIVTVKSEDVEGLVAAREPDFNRQIAIVDIEVDYEGLEEVR